jgi:A/G-specific adenine glycosylase
VVRRARCAPTAGWYRANRRDLPWRRVRDPYAVWISEAMLQQTRVETVIPYWERFLALFPDVASLAAAEPDAVLGAWAGLGYYSRARNLHRAAKAVAALHGGRLPDTAEGLRELPGIGRYTAGAVASIAFDRPEPVVDGNVARARSRCGIRRPAAAVAARPEARRRWRPAERRPEPGADGARRAGLHAARTSLPRLPAAPPLRGLCSGRRRVAPGQGAQAVAARWKR